VGDNVAVDKDPAFSELLWMSILARILLDPGYFPVEVRQSPGSIGKIRDSVEGVPMFNTGVGQNEDLKFAADVALGLFGFHHVIILTEFVGNYKDYLTGTGNHIGSRAASASDTHRSMLNWWR